MNAGHSHHNIMKTIRKPTSCGLQGPTASAGFVLEFCLCPVGVTVSREECEGVLRACSAGTAGTSQLKHSRCLLKQGEANEGGERATGVTLQAAVSDGPCIWCSHSFPYVHECCILAAFLACLEWGLLLISVNEHTDQKNTKSNQILHLTQHLLPRTSTACAEWCAVRLFVKDLQIFLTH